MAFPRTRESREVRRIAGFPIPAFAGASFSGMTEEIDFAILLSGHRCGWTFSGTLLR